MSKIMNIYDNSHYSRWTPTLPVPIKERLVRVDWLAGVDIPIMSHDLLKDIHAL